MAASESLVHLKGRSLIALNLLDLRRPRTLIPNPTRMSSRIVGEDYEVRRRQRQRNGRGCHRSRMEALLVSSENVGRKRSSELCEYYPKGRSSEMRRDEIWGNRLVHFKGRPKVALRIANMTQMKDNRFDDFE